jgi:hypothetical protein
MPWATEKSCVMPLPVLSLDWKSYTILIYIQKQKPTFPFCPQTEQCTLSISRFLHQKNNVQRPPPVWFPDRTMRRDSLPLSFQTEQCAKSFPRFASNFLLRHTKLKCVRNVEILWHDLQSYYYKTEFNTSKNGDGHNLNIPRRDGRFCIEATGIFQFANYIKVTIRHTHRVKYENSIIEIVRYWPM